MDLYNEHVRWWRDTGLSPMAARCVAALTMTTDILVVLAGPGLALYGLYHLIAS
jgi:hypothetical protein